MEEITAFLKHSTYYAPGTLVNNPTPLPGQAEPICIYLWTSDGTDSTAEYSIVVPVHNQQDIIGVNLLSIVDKAVGKCELIIILDGCRDKSREAVLSLVESQVPDATPITQLVRIVVIEQSTGIFETSSDNIGFRLAKGRYIVEVQADMKVITYAFNYILSLPCRKYPKEIFAVSARCCHAWAGAGDTSREFGKLGLLVEEPWNLKWEQQGKVFMSDTCNRGPLLLRRSVLEKLGYLDEQNFVQDDCDHDLMWRAFYTYGLRCGCVPVEFHAPLVHGSNRQPRPKDVQDFLDARRQRGHNKGFLHTNPPPVSTGSMLAKSIDLSWIKL